jgi:hypothetical protein
MTELAAAREALRRELERPLSVPMSADDAERMIAAMGTLTAALRVELILALLRREGGPRALN